VILGDKEWTTIISKGLNVSGSYFYKQANDVARLAVPLTSGDSLETFSMAFTDVGNTIKIHLGWGTVRVTVPFTKEIPLIFKNQKRPDMSRRFFYFNKTSFLTD
jgi:hypothetical protein